MAARYWVGGTGTWDATTTTKWSATNGGTGGASVPGTADDVYFTSLSSGASYTVTRTATTSVLSITMNGPASGTLTFAGTSTIGISTGNLTVGATGTVSWTNTGVLTKSGSGTITTNAVTINSPITVSGTGITVTLGSNLTMGTARTFTLGAGTLNLSTYTLSCGLFASTTSSTRNITFGSGSKINLTSTATNTVWSFTTATGFTTTGTPDVNLTGAAASGITRTITLPAGAAQYVNFTISAGAAGSTVSISSGNNITFTSGYSGAVTNAAGTITGDLILSSTISSWTSNANILTFSGASNTITAAGETIGCPITITGTTTLNDNVIVNSIRTVTVNGGTFNTNGKNFTCGTFTILNGTLNTSSGTTFTTSVATNIGTASPYNPTINFINSTVSLAAVLFYSGDIITPGSTVTVSTLNQSRNSSATACSLDVSSATSFTTTGLYTLSGYSATVGATLDLSNKTINVHSMAAGGTDDLTTIVFSTTGRINLTGNNATIWNSPSSTYLTFSGTPDIRCTYSGATGTRTLIADTLVTNVQFPIKITAGTDTVSMYGAFGDVDFTGFSGTIAPAGTLVITGSLIIPATVLAVTASAQVLEFNGVDVTLNTNGEVINMQVTVSGGSLTLLNTLSVNSGRTVNINGGTFNTNGYSFSCGILNIGTASPYNPTIQFSNVTSVTGLTTFSSGYVVGTGAFSFEAITQLRNSSATACELDVSGSSSFTTTGLYTLGGNSATTDATLTLTDKTLNCHSMSVGNTDDLTYINFGSIGRINLTGNNATIWNSSASTYVFFTGVPDIRCTYSGATGTRTLISDTLITNIQVPIKVTTGTDTVSIYGAFGDVDFTGFSGTIAPAGTLVITSSLIIPATVVAVTSAQTLQFNGTTTLTTNGDLINMPVTLVAGSLTLNDSLNIGTQTLTVTAGTLNTNSFDITCNIFSSSNSNIRTFNLGSSTITLSGTGVVWSLATSTNATVNAGTSSIVLSNNTTTSRTFAGGSKTYYNLIIGGVSSTSATTISGSNTFNELSSTKIVAHTITFTAATTNTFSKFSISGPGTSFVTINSTSTTPHNLVKSGSGFVDSSYLNISYSSATPANTWYAGTSSTQGASVSGWIFDSAPPVSTSNSFFFGSNF